MGHVLFLKYLDLLMLIHVDMIVLVVFIDILSYSIHSHMNSLCFFMNKLNKTLIAIDGRRNSFWIKIIKIEEFSLYILNKLIKIKWFINKLKNHKFIIYNTIKYTIFMDCIYSDNISEIDCINLIMAI